MTVKLKSNLCVENVDIFLIFDTIIWNNAGLFLVDPMETNFSDPKHDNFHLGKWIWECGKQNGGHFVLASMCLRNIEYENTQFMMSRKITSGLTSRLLISVLLNDKSTRYSGSQWPGLTYGQPNGHWLPSGCLVDSIT